MDTNLAIQCQKYSFRSKDNSFSKKINIFSTWYLKKSAILGPCWRSLVGGTYVYGNVDSEGEFTGQNIAFIYQDLDLALVGEFNKGIMVRIELKNYMIYCIFGCFLFQFKRLGGRFGSKAQ